MPAASRSRSSAQFTALPSAPRSRRRGPAVSRRFGRDESRGLATPASRGGGDLLLPAVPRVQASNPGQGLVTFSGGDAGEWRVHSQGALRGEPLPAARRLSVAGNAALAPGSVWSNTWSNLWQLRGLACDDPVSRWSDWSGALPALDHRSGAVQATLVAIRRNAAWWAMTPDARADVLASTPRHVATGLEHKPGAACRRLDCRNLGSPQPFDALHWFEYAADGAPAVDDLLAAWRASPEWAYVDRDVDLRLLRD